MMAMKAVVSSMIMVLLLVYIFGITICHLMEDQKEVNLELRSELQRDFSTLVESMWTLMLDGTWMVDAGVIVATLRNAGGYSCVSALICFVVFICMSAMMIMNMLIGILCDVVTSVAEGERDDAAL